MGSKFRIKSDSADKIFKWVEERGGIAVWRSLDLSNPGGQWITPAKDSNGNLPDRPHWSAEKTPEIISNLNDIEVIEPREVKRFRVALRRGSGFMIECTDASSRKIRKSLSEAGDSSWYEFDYETQECVIYAPGRVVGLSEYQKGR